MVGKATLVATMLLLIAPLSVTLAAPSQTPSLDIWPEIPAWQGDEEALELMRFGLRLGDGSLPAAAGPWAALLEEPWSPEMVAEAFGIDHAFATDVLDHLGPELTSLLAVASQSRHVLDTRDLAQFFLWLAPQLIVAMDHDGLPHGMELCPEAGRSSSQGVLNGDYGAYGGLCITGTDAQTIDVVGSAFGTWGGVFIDLGGDDVFTQSGTTVAFGGWGGLFMDLGGNDTHEGGGGNSHGPIGGVYFDLEGDDVQTAAGASMGSGGGIFIDFGGDDTRSAGTGMGNLAGIYYDHAGDDTVAGGGLGNFGGLFVDARGNDDYVGHASTIFGSTGGAFIDRGGNDRYVVGSTQQQFATTFGSRGGIFVDSWGDDSYATFGLQNFAALGGLFIDGLGDDTYRAGPNSFGTGGGLFIDGGGDDSYWSEGTAANPGVHGHGQGQFYDLTGDDVYYTTAYDAFGGDGVFYDGSGNDNYRSGPHGFASVGQITPVAPGWSLFFDGAGDDTYAAGDYSFGTLGTFIDQAGDDTYPSITGGYGTAPYVFSSLLDYTNEAPGVFWDMAGTGYQNDRLVTGGFYHSSAALAEPIEAPRAYDGDSPAAPAPLPLASSMDTVMGLLGSLYDLGLTIDRRVVAVGQTHTYTGTLTTTTPVDLIPIASDAKIRFAGPAAVPVAGGFYAPNGDDVEMRIMSDIEGYHAIGAVVVDATHSAPLGRHDYGDVAFDGTPPVVTISLDDGQGSTDSGRFHSEPDGQVRLTAHDALAGLKAIWISTGAPPDTSQPATVAFTVDPEGFGDAGIWQDHLLLGDLGDGVHEVYVAAHDSLDLETVASLTVRVDTTPPDVSFNVTNGTIGQNGWYTQAPNVTANATDALAGVRRAVARWAGATQTPDITLNAAPRSILGPGELEEGISRVEVETIDNAHLANERSDEQALVIQYDATPPTTSLSMPQELAAPARFDFSATDNASGVNQTVIVATHDVAGSNTVIDAQGDNVTLDRPGPWTLTYHSIDHAGNVEDAQTAQVTIDNNPPTAAISAPATGLTGQPIAFADASTDNDGTITAWDWDLGDGTTSDLASFTHAYADDGTYHVTLTVSDDLGATASTDHVLVIANRPPVAAFSWLPTNPVVGQSVTFSDGSDDPDGTVLDHAWDIAGTPATGPTAEHVFDASGTYVVRLTVTDDDGAEATLERTVTVFDVPPVVADFDWSPTEIDTLTDVAFTDLTQGPAGDLEYAWTIDGTPYNVAAPTHRFTDPGTKSITLSVSHENGDSDAVTKQLDVSGIAPVADFAAEASALTGTPIAFTDASTDADDGLETWNWDFGDGQSSTDASPIHAFDDDGTYTVTLTVTDRHGLSDTASMAIEILNRPPTAQWSEAPLNALTLDDVSFAVDADDPDGDAPTIAITIEGTTYGSPATHAFATPGEYPVTATITDDDGASIVLSHLVTIANRDPTIAISAQPTTPLSGETVTFTADAADPDGTAPSVAWTIEGVTKTGTSVTHTFGTPGTKTVTATATDDHAASATATLAITIGNRAPTIDSAGTQAPPKSPTVGLTASATDPDGTVASYAWSIEGETKAGQTIEHTFTGPGTFTVAVTATDDLGLASAPYTFDVTIPDQPPVAVITAPATAEVDEAITLTDASTDDVAVTGRAWDLGDGNESAAASVAHTYTKAGTYTVKLTVTDASGGTDTAQHTVTVTEKESVDTTTPPASPAPPSAPESADKESPWLSLPLLLAGLVVARRLSRP